MKRYYFIGDDLGTVAAVERQLLERDVAAEKIHVLSLDDTDAERRHLHDVQSLMKRDVKIKDTSRALPGHGGMLDRFDSVLFVAPLVYYYLRFVVYR